VSIAVQLYLKHISNIVYTTSTRIFLEVLKNRYIYLTQY